MLAAALSSAALAAPAHAQDLPLRNGILQLEPPGVEPVSVDLRPRPWVSAQGVPIGPVRVYPEVEAGVVFTSNLYAQVDAEAALGAVLAPRITGRYEWRQNTLELYARSRFEQFPGNESESTEQVWAGAVVELKPSGTSFIRAVTEAARLIEPRSSNFSPRDTRKPVEYERLWGQVWSDIEFGRLHVAPGVRAFRFNFFDAESRSTPGLLIDQDRRDRTEIEPQINIGYEFSSLAGIFIGAAYNWRDYDDRVLGGGGAMLNQDSRGGAAFVGARFGSPLLQTRVALGYVQQNYHAPFRDISGLYAVAEVKWFPTGLTTVTGGVSRDVSESGGSLIANGALNTRAVFEVDHELYRNVILTAEGGFDVYAFQGYDRVDRRWRLRLGGRYLANQNLEFTGDVSYLNQTSSGAFATIDFDEARASFSGVLKW